MTPDNPRTDHADADEWSIVSGGGDGTVAHWSLRGFLGDGLQTRQQDGTTLLKIGIYEVMAELKLDRTLDEAYS